MPSPPEIRLDFPHAEDVSLAAEIRIRTDLAAIARRVAHEDRHLHALVLTGGFSRGEGTVRHDAPVNDYDLVAIRRAPGAGGLYQRLGHDLTEEIGLEVDLMPVWKARLPFVGRKLFWLDVRLGGRVLVGDPGALDAIRRFTPADVDRAEIARLLGNRAAGLLLALPGPDAPVDVEMRDLQATKAVLAALDATLLHQGLYAPRLRERLALTLGHPDHALFSTAVEWKLKGRADLPADWWDEAAACLLRAVDATGARRMRDGPVEVLIHLLRARRLRFSPSRAVRETAWELLAMSRFPHGPREGQAALPRLGVEEATSWPRLKERFFEVRAKTLQ